MSDVSGNNSIKIYKLSESPFLHESIENTSKNCQKLALGMQELRKHLFKKSSLILFKTESFVSL